MTLALLLAGAGGLFSLALALRVALRDLRSVAHASFAVGLLLLGAEAVFSGLCVQAEFPDQMIAWQRWRLETMAFLPGTWLLFSLCYSRGNYQEFLRRWRIPLVLAFLAPLGVVVAFPDQLVVGAQLLAPTGQWVLRLGRPGVGLNVLMLVAVVLILMNLERTFWTSVGTMRWRLKYMVLGLGLWLVLSIYICSQAMLYGSVDLSLERARGGVLVVACLLMTVSLSRAGLLNVDLYPSHSLLYNSLTALLVGVYLVIVGLLAQAVTWMGGGEALPLRAFVVLVSLVVLTALLLSERIRLRLKRWVGRHLRRPMYDYRRVWKTFTDQTTSLLEERALCRATANWLSNSFQMLSVTVWLLDRGQGRLVFGASTSLPENAANDLAGTTQDLHGLAARLRDQPYPVDIDDSRQEGVEVLRLLHPDYFPSKGGNRICVPLVAAGELLGLITLGDRVGGVSFTVEELDVLKCIGDQVAANLLNVQLSQRLLQAKEMEAFQTMSAFFVHDLKNTASALSLMLQNLETHFADPAFREDALRAVSKSVHHLNDLIGRLSVLRQEMKMNLVPADLNAVVEEALASLPLAAGVRLTKALGELPKLLLDPGEIKKVILNLVLNAADAVGSAGDLRIETNATPGWGRLTVTDTGCGMSPEFLQHSLFRPFQTTKKRGIGIGMFHTKMIVDAHRGKIEVQSERGKGTTVRVWLPN